MKFLLSFIVLTLITFSSCIVDGVSAMTRISSDDMLKVAN